MPRNILFITTDQQRYDSLGCTGGTIARTPVVDALAADGINYQPRAQPEHRVHAVALDDGHRAVPADARRRRERRPAAGRRAERRRLPARAAATAPRCSARRTSSPASTASRKWIENRMAHEDSTGPYRGFEHLELALHTPGFAGFAIQHYGKWLERELPGRDVAASLRCCSAEPAATRGAPETTHNPVPREHYHTDWVADRTIAWLDSLGADEPWFCWMSFPDPHHPWDPPSSELHRVPWRELDLPPGHPGSHERSSTILSQKPRHWLDWYEGRCGQPRGRTRTLRPGRDDARPGPRE